MTISFNGLHTMRLVQQIMTNLVNLQDDLRRNATAWRGMAVAIRDKDELALPIEKLQSFMSDASKAYAERLRWVGDFKDAKTAKWNEVSVVLDAFGSSTQEVESLNAQLKAIVDSFSTAKKVTAEDIIAACDSIIAVVTPLESIWPE